MSKGKTARALTDRTGINAVSQIFTSDFGWFFREQPILDWGIDAHVEIVAGDEATGQLLAIQVKSGESYFRRRGENFVYRGDGRHFEYWLNYSLPVYLILHNPDSGLTIWQRISRETCARVGDRWSVEIPPTQYLDRDAKEALEGGTPEASRRAKFAEDLGLMKQIASGQAIFCWDEWVNKSLGFRDLAIYLDAEAEDLPEKPDHTIPFMLPTHDLHEAMSVIFPWAQYEYGRHIEDHEEVVAHVLTVRLSAAAAGYLAAETFFKEGTRSGRRPEPPIDEDDHEARFRAALEKDWEDEAFGPD